MLSYRWIINCALLALIGALALIGLNFDRPSVDTQGTRISDLALGDIDRIEIRSADRQLKLSRHLEDWTIELPINWPAHKSNVERLMSIVNSNAEMLAGAADVDLGALGLEQPVARLRFNNIELLFGASNNIGGRRYLMIDSKIYLLPDIHLAFVEQGLTGMVDRQLLPKRYRIESIQLPELTVQRDADGQWQTLPEGQYSQAQVQRLVDNWQELQASRIKPFDPGDPVPQLVEVRLADGRSIDFLVISTDTELIIANPGIGMQYHFLKAYRDQLLSVSDTTDAS